MASRAATYACAGLVGLLSLAAAAYTARMQISTARILTTRIAAQVAPMPSGNLPPGIVQPPSQAPPDGAQQRALAQAIWRDPLDPKLFNLLYVDSIRLGQSGAVIAQRANLLAKLGWRFTPAQQNLMIRAVFGGKYPDVVDRVDALLRRQKLPAAMFGVLMAMEAEPEVHRTVINKMLARSIWRQDYLSVISAQTAPNVLVARIRTMDELLGSPAGLSRDEMAPSLVALMASGHGRDAHRLWLRRTDPGEAGELTYDTRFQQAARYVGTSDLSIPFEWRLAQNLGYSVQASSSGVTVEWDRRGAPAFLSQVVPVEPGRAYLLRIMGKSGSENLARLLAPTLTCGTMVVQPFDGIGGADGALYRFAPLPRACDMGLLTINGALDLGMGEVSIDVSQISLRRR